jgi:chemotaxis protein CheX
MNVAYVNPFLDATIHIFEQTFGISPVPGEPFLDKQASKHRWDISAVMVLTGTAVGVVVIRVTHFLADKLLTKSGVIWKDDEERAELVNAMIGEIVNIIAGNAASKLIDSRIEISVPFVIQGENHTIAWPAQTPILGVPFTTEYGPFLVNVSIFELPKAYQV